MLPTTEFALFRRIATEQAAGRAPSLVAAVVRDGTTVWSGSRGSVHDASPNNNTQYRIGSITKPLVATVVLRLRDEGRLDLGDPLDTYVPGTSFGDTTIAQLLAHTGGLTSESPGEWWERSPGHDWEHLNASLSPETVKHRPGRRFHYSNVGYGVLGELVARVRGVAWWEAVHSEVLEPLGMSRTTRHPLEHHAPGYAVHPFADVLLPEPAYDAGAMAPAGQLWSCITDLARWTSFIGGHGEGVLAPETMAEMREAATVDDDSSSWVTGYGLGVQLVNREGKRLAGHTGSMPGFLACAMTDPSTGTGAVALANATSGPATLPLVCDLITIMDECEPPLPAPWRPADIDPDLLGLTGLWHWGPTPYHLHILAHGWLSLTPVNSTGRSSRFRPLGTDRWLGLDGYFAGETLTVVREEHRTPHHLNVATFIFTRSPYDPSAPIPGGLDPEGWRS